MSKRGEKRPHLVRFQWDNGIKGSDSFTTAERAQDYADMIRLHAELRETTVEVEIIDRTAKADS